MFKKLSGSLLIAAGLACSPAQALVVSATTDASALTSSIIGTGITIVGTPTLSVASDTGAGTFSAGAASIGIDSGVLLTTGTVSCAPGPNNSGSCSGPGTTTDLTFSFTSDTGKLYFSYVFASEEYNEYVGSEFNDEFELLLNGTNIALLPGSSTVVSINTVNLGANSAYYRDNNLGLLDTQYDGLTTILTAEANVLAGVNTFEFLIFDRGDSAWDSGVFIKGGSFSAEAPEPGILALIGLGLASLGLRRSRKQA